MAISIDPFAKSAACFLAVFFVCAGYSASASERSIKLGVAADAAPFSYAAKNGEAVGYSVDLCRHIANAAVDGGLYENIDVVWVTVSNRFRFLAQREIDLLCESTTVTFERMRHFDFTLRTFLSGASFMFRADERRFGLQDIGNGPVGTAKGTTTEELVRASLPDAEVELVNDDRQGIELLASGAIRAYFGDRELLLRLRDEAAGRDSPVRLNVADRYLSFEPYAIGVRPDPETTPCDERRRLLVIANQTLSDLFRNEEIEQIFAAHFPRQVMSATLQQQFKLQVVTRGAPLEGICG